MRKSILLTLAVSLTAVAAFGQPSINPGGVVNSASYIPPGLPNSGIAQGSLFIIKGKNLGACGTVVANEFPLKTTMGGTSIKVGTRDAWMVYVVACRGKDAAGKDYPDQLAAVLPSDTPIGNAQVTVTYNGQTSASVTAQIVRSTFGAFTINQGGTGPFVIQNWTPTVLPVNTRFASATPGQTVIVWGTGLGPINASQDNGPGPVGNIAGVTVDIFVGGKKVTPAYYGRSSCCSGIDQISFVVPSGVEGCNVPVTVVVDGIPSNFGTMSVAASGQTCSDPNGYSAADLNRLSGLQDIRMGVVALSRVKMSLEFSGVSIDMTTDSGTADFEKLTQAQFMGKESGSGSITPGACYVVSANETVEAATLPRQGLDAGSAITAARQGGVSKQMVKNALGGDLLKGVYQTPAPINPLSPDLWLESGNWTITGPGGTDVGAFNLNLVVPPNLNWTNRAAITSVARSQGVTVQWTGGDSNSFVFISGSSASGKVSGTFYCIERVPAGQFTVPSWVLAALPATGSTEDDMGMIGLGTSSLPAMPSTLPNGLDYLIAVSSSMDMKTVKYQ